MIVLLVSDHTVIKTRALMRTLLAGLAQPIYQLLSEHDKQSLSSRHFQSPLFGTLSHPQ